ncbi:MAG: AAA family ATPase [Thermoleophilaceae bacterium]|nr:AAA family ATPase [Thermoleophilaceae bacterium]
MATRQAERPVLLERADELAAVDALLADVVGGAGRLAVIEGPAGIGKSSILAEGRARAAGGGMTVLNARGTEIERPFSYGVVRQLFETLLAQADAEQRATLLEGAAAHAGRLFEPDRLADEGRAGADAAFALLHGLYWLTLNLAEPRPLLISVDDLQWADEASLRWLAFLARRLEGAAVGVLAAVRPIEEEDPVLAELLADPATTVVRPAALTPPAAAELVRAALSPDADDAFCLACHRTTGGNPLLLRELVRTLAAEDLPPSAASVDAVERLAPDAVARSVKLRLSRLPPEAAALARAVAILGDDAGGKHATALAGIEKRALAPAAAARAGGGRRRPAPPRRFVHPVVRNAVYETSPPHVREQEHARAAAVLRSAAAPVEQVAGQVLLAPAESVEDAVAPLREAASRAAAEGAPESAARYLRRALDEPLADGERADLLLDLAGAELGLGAPTAVDRLREAVALMADPERRALAELELGRALYWAGHEEEGVRVLERALLAREGADDELQRRLEGELIANSTRLASHYEDARRRLDAVDVGADEGPGARMLLSLQAYHEAARGGSRARATSRAEQALAAMGGEERAWSYTAGSYALLFGDRLEEGVRMLDPTLAAVRRRGAVFNFSSLSMMRAIFHYARGALVEAEADARMALDALPHRDVWFVPHAHGWLAQILVERGALDEAAGVLGKVEMALDAPADPFSRTPLLRARTMLAAARGNHRAALEDALDLGRALAAYGHDNPAASYPAWRSLAALAHRALGETDAALSLAREEAELARAWGAPRALGRSLRVLGLIEGGGEGIDRLREAVAVLEGSPARLEHAYAMTDLGASLRRGNRRAEARDLLREALELAQRLGAGALADRAREELVATGARPRRLVMSGVDSLTPSERRIAAMAAEGLSNREIAQALFVTLRTVEMHLSNAFRKLDIASRTQLPSALASPTAGPVAAGPA